MFAHDEAVAHEALRHLEDWAESCEPRHPSESVRSALDSCRGTVIEPFRLSPRVKDVVVVLLRAAFSRRHLVTRFRIVSEECLGDLGGAVFTNNLQHYYVERFALGARRRDPSNGWMIAPLSGRQLFLGTPASRIRGAISLKDSGVSIRIEGIGSGFHRVFVEGKALAGGMFGISHVARSTIIEPARSEAALQLLALCSNDSTLRVVPADEAAGLRAFFKLRPPGEDGETVLPSMVALNVCDYSGWLSAGGAQARFTPGPKVLLQEGFPVPMPWIPAALKEFS
jgi:hypothetical protein